MLFNSFSFLVFFPAVVLVYFIIPKKIRYIWLLIASYYFYMQWNAKYVLLLLFSTAVTYASGLVLEHIKGMEENEAKKTAAKKVCVAVSFILNLSILFLFKYFDFAVQNINALLCFSERRRSEKHFPFFEAF